MGRPRKPKEELSEAKIRCSMTKDVKSLFIKAAKEDAFDQVSLWMKHLAQARIRQLRKEGWEPDQDEVDLSDEDD